MNNAREKAWQAFKKRGFHNQLSEVFAEAWNTAWSAAMEQKDPPEGYYKIGEEVEINIRGEKYKKATVCAVKQGRVYALPDSIRRIPALEPKDGEAVLAKSKSGKAFYAVSAGGIYIYNNICPVSGIIEAYDIKPWKPDCQGKPWGEV